MKPEVLYAASELARQLEEAGLSVEVTAGIAGENIVIEASLEGGRVPELGVSLFAVSVGTDIHQAAGKTIYRISIKGKAPAKGGSAL